MKPALLPPARLTQRDYAIMRGIALHRPIAPRGYYTLLNTRLISAEVLEAVDDDIVTIDSLVRYRVGAGNTLEHRLVVGSFEALMGKTVSVRTLVGVAMLGARALDVIPLSGLDEQEVMVEAVTHPAPDARASARWPERKLMTRG